MCILTFLKRYWVRRSSESLIKYYRALGIKIGDGCIFRSPGTTQIDTMRPSLISIGSNVDMNKNFTLMAHDFTHRVFVLLYDEFLSSSGHIRIGDNVYFGMNVSVLKGVTIGNNCIIGAGSIVTHDIPANSVATGIPCKVVCSLDEYYKKRQDKWEQEAISYVKTIRETFHRDPKLEEFIPEFGLYVDSHNIDQYDISLIKDRLGDKFDYWMKNHIAPYDGFNDFLNRSK